MCFFFGWIVIRGAAMTDLFGVHVFHGEMNYAADNNVKIRLYIFSGNFKFNTYKQFIA